MATKKATPSVAGKTDKSTPIKKAPVAKTKMEAKEDKKDTKKVVVKKLPAKEAPKKEEKRPAPKPVLAAKPTVTKENAKVQGKEDKKAKTTSTGKTIYHVSKRGESKADREWKVFIQGSDKVIKLFDTQEEALKYAKDLADNKNDGSTVMLHGLDGKIRKC